MQSQTTISQKGQIVVPKNIRDYLKIKPTDTLTVNLEGKRIIVEPVSSIDEVYGTFKVNKAVSKKEIKESAKKHLFSKHKITSK